MDFNARVVWANFFCLYPHPLQTQSYTRGVQKAKNRNANRRGGVKSRSSCHCNSVEPPLGGPVHYVSLSWVHGVDGLWEDLSWDA